MCRKGGQGFTGVAYSFIIVTFLEPSMSLLNLLDCHVPCHAQCIDSIPNNCKALVPELTQPPAKKQKQDILPATARKTQHTPSAPAPAPAPQSTPFTLSQATTSTASANPAISTVPAKPAISTASTQKLGKKSTSEQEKGPPKKRSRKDEVVLLNVRKTNNEYDSTDGKSLEVVKGAASQSKGTRKGNVQLTKVKQLNTSYEERDGPALASNKVVGFSPPNPRAALMGSPTDCPPGAAELNGKSKYIKNIYTGFESRKVIKMEQTSQPR